MLHYDVSGRTQLRLQDRDGTDYLVATDPPVTANNGDFLRDMAIAGHGLILAPSFIVWQALAAGALVSVLPDFCPPRLHAYAVYLRNRYLSRRARMFIDFLVERFGDNPYWDQYTSP